MKTFHFILCLASKAHCPTKEKVEVKISDKYNVLELKTLIKPDFRSEFKKLFINEREWDQEYINRSDLEQSCKKDEVTIYLDDKIHIRFKYLDKLIDFLLEITIPTNVNITFQQLLEILKAQYLIKFEGEIFLDGIETPVLNKELDLIWDCKIRNYTTLYLKCDKNFYQEESKKANDDKKKELETMMENVEKDVQPFITRQEKIAEYALLKERLKDDICTLMFLGGVSAGKTTLINKILSSFLNLGNAEEILKTNEKENTRFIWVLKHGEYVSITFDGGPEEKFESIEDEFFKERIKVLNRRGKAEIFNKLVEVHLNFPFLPEKLKLIDFPGYASNEIYERIKDFVLMSEFSHFFILDECRNPVKVMEYEDKLFKNFASLIENNKRKKDIDFFLIYTKKDEYFLGQKEKIMIKRHKYLIQKVLNMEKREISVKNVFVINLTETMQCKTFLRIMEQIEKMIKATPLYKFKYFLNELHSLFEKEKEDTLKVVLKPNVLHQQDLEKLRTKKDAILGRYKEQMTNYMNEFKVSQYLSEEVKNESIAIDIKNECRSSFIEKVAESSKKNIVEHLQEKIKTLFVDSIRDFLTEISEVFDKNYITNALRLTNDQFNSFFCQDFRYDAQNYFCMFFNIPYSFISQIPKSGFKHKIVSFFYWIRNNLWTFSGGKADSIKHLNKKLEVQKDVLINQGLKNLREILEREYEKFEYLIVFDEKYEFAKNIICNLEEQFCKKFNSEIIQEEKDATNRLEFEDVYGKLYPELAESFQFQKIKQINKFQKT